MNTFIHYSNSAAISGGGGGCQADDCGADLKDAKQYHRRHKVCEPHAKDAFVLVKGIRQRFCQQCSRFHEISKFDGTKRSCRDRLAGHNLRRRKARSSKTTAGSTCIDTVTCSTISVERRRLDVADGVDVILLEREGLNSLCLAVRTLLHPAKEKHDIY
ncbi:hypothetical protein GOBAR_AA31930 [Gossypium barbadense]|uniref:SBP-type domain-containing protein n=1 Tax=Gossypium barbadense TaxID=3634 RepID=A0A2P5WCE2_GOSBA|nr:hypothetical protein GOBAR_AA31930 [Gossypium barbadense]